jgi:hypothetical protein
LKPDVAWSRVIFYRHNLACVGKNSPDCQTFCEVQRSRFTEFENMTEAKNFPHSIHLGKVA